MADPREPPTVYLDNAAAVLMPPPVVDSVARWLNRGDAGGGHASAREGRRLLEAYRREVAAEGAFELEGPLGFSVVLTSGGAEANSHVLSAAVRAYSRKTGKLPHLVTSVAEDPSVLACCRALVLDRLAQVSYLPVAAEGGALGSVAPRALRAALRPNTCLVSLFAAGSSTGALNNLRALGEVAHAARVPFHSDARMLYGRSAFHPRALNLDAFSAEARSHGGPPGAGLLVLRNDFLAGYGLGALIGGPEEGGLRGGAANLPAFAGAFAALRLAAADRGAKNARTARLREALLAGLARACLCVSLDEYRAARPRVPDRSPATPASARVAAPAQSAAAAGTARALDAAADEGRAALVYLGPPDPARALPGLLLFSALLPPGACALGVRRALEARRLLVGHGGDVGPLGLPPELEEGAFQVCLSDASSREDVRRFLEGFARVAAAPSP
jgi:cysteine sulfinate desulfinase/cysteine desulfurase-like protein